jgi:prevent-host-death family protein
MVAWKMDTANGRLSELLRHARESGPQRITVGGKDAAIVLSGQGYDHLTWSQDGINSVDQYYKAAQRLPRVSRVS